MNARSLRSGSSAWRTARSITPDSSRRSGTARRDCARDRTDPDVLVADEPTGDLDAKSAEDILDLMETLNRDFKKTIVMVTHDPRAAARAHVERHLEKGVLTATVSRQEAVVGGR